MRRVLASVALAVACAGGGSGAPPPRTGAHRTPSASAAPAHPVAASGTSESASQAAEAPPSVPEVTPLFPRPPAHLFFEPQVFWAVLEVFEAPRCLRFEARPRPAPPAPTNELARGTFKVDVEARQGWAYLSYAVQAEDTLELGPIRVVEPADPVPGASLKSVTIACRSKSRIGGSYEKPTLDGQPLFRDEEDCRTFVSSAIALPRLPPWFAKTRIFRGEQWCWYRLGQSLQRSSRE